MTDISTGSGEAIPADSLELAPQSKCVFCGKDSNNGIFLRQGDKEKLWDFEGEGACLECYINHLCHKYAKEAINDNPNH